MGNEYKTHSFKKDWHDQVEKFIEEHEDLAFDSPKYFIKFCVNKFMQEQEKQDLFKGEDFDKLVRAFKQAKDE